MIRPRATQSIGRPAVSSRRLALAFVLALVLCFRSAFADGSQAQRLIAASTLPTAHSRYLIAAMSAQAGSEFVVQQLVTMGDSAKLKTAIAQAGDTPIIICMDMPVLHAATKLGNLRTVAGISSHNMLEGPQAPAPPSAYVVTCPTAQDVLDALAQAGLGESPLGLVYTVNYPPSEEFARVFQEECGDLLHAESDFADDRPRACAVDPGACRSLGDIEFALRRTFRNLPAGSPLVVYPEGNTLKFAYAFERFAREKNLVLISVGDFPSATAPVSVAISVEDTARALLEAARGNGDQTSIKASVRIDRDKLEAITNAASVSTGPDLAP